MPSKIEMIIARKDAATRLLRKATADQMNYIAKETLDRDPAAIMHRGMWVACAVDKSDMPRRLGVVGLAGATGLTSAASAAMALFPECEWIEVFAPATDAENEAAAADQEREQERRDQTITYAHDDHA